MKDFSAKIQLLGLISYLSVTFLYCDAFQPFSHNNGRPLANIMTGIDVTTRGKEFQQARRGTLQFPLRMSSKDDNNEKVRNIIVLEPFISLF